jgi:hypothetical protein
MRPACGVVELLARAGAGASPEKEGSS